MALQVRGTPTSPLHLPYISPYISPISRQAWLSKYALPVLEERKGEKSFQLRAVLLEGASTLAHLLDADQLQAPTPKPLTRNPTPTPTPAPNLTLTLTLTLTLPYP